MSEELTDQVASETVEETIMDGSDWMDSIPEDLRNDPSLADIKDISSLAKGYVHAQHMIGADKVVLPGKDAPQEELDVFYNKLGRPEEVGGYRVPTENMPDTPVDGDLANTFFQEAHRIGLSKSQAAALIRFNSEQQAEQVQSAEANFNSTMEQTEQVLRGEYGNAYDQNLQMAQKAAHDFGGDELIAALNKSGLGNDPSVIRAFHNVAKVISNDEIIGGGGRQGFVMAPGEAKQSIADNQRDPNFMSAYQDAGHAGHQEAVQEMGRLYSSAYPSIDE